MRPDLDDERVDALVRNSAAALHPRDDGAAADIEGQRIERDMEAEISWPLVGLSGPIVEPGSFGQVDVRLSSRLDDRGDEKPGPEHVLEILIKDILVIGKGEGQRPDNGKPFQAGFESRAIYIRKKLVPQESIFPNHRNQLLADSPRFARAIAVHPAV